MRFFGPANILATVDDGACLLFTFKRQRRWADALWIAIATGGSLFALSAGDFLIALGAVAVALTFLFHFLFHTVSSVRASDQGIEGSTQQKYGGRTTWVALWKEISGLEYAGGGEDEPSGLYVRRGLHSSLCVLDTIGKEETLALIDAIYRRFPLVAMADDPRGLPSLFGYDKLTTLGLSSDLHKR